MHIHRATTYPPLFMERHLCARVCVAPRTHIYARAQMSRDAATGGDSDGGDGVNYPFASSDIAQDHAKRCCSAEKGGEQKKNIKEGRKRGGSRALVKRNFVPRGVSATCFSILSRTREIAVAVSRYAFTFSRPEGSSAISARPGTGGGSWQLAEGPPRYLELWLFRFNALYSMRHDRIGSARDERSRAETRREKRPLHDAAREILSLSLLFSPPSPFRYFLVLSASWG